MIITPPKDDAAPEPPKGIRCPDCQCGHCPVYRTTRLLRKVRRERQCRHCGRRFFTTEDGPSDR